MPNMDVDMESNANINNDMAERNATKDNDAKQDKGSNKDVLGNGVGMDGAACSSWAWSSLAPSVEVTSFLGAARGQLKDRAVEEQTLHHASASDKIAGTIGKFDGTGKEDGTAKGDFDDKGFATEGFPVVVGGSVGEGLAATRGTKQIKVKLEVPLVRTGVWDNALVRSDWLEYDPDRRAAAAPNVPEMSRRERRSAENAGCIGGLRSPWRAVRRLPGLAVAGRMVRNVLEKQFFLDPTLVDIVDVLGLDLNEDAEKEKWIEDKAKLFGDMLVDALKGKTTEKDANIKNPWNADLVEAFRNLSGDPEVHLATWLRKGCPAGVAGPIPSCGIFPETDVTDAAAEDSKDINEEIVQTEPGQNYDSVDFYPELSGGEVDRLIEKGFAVRYGSWDEVLSDFGGALVSKLACIVKQRDDGSLKVRNVLDLRRSGYNEHVALAERVVLPRMKDLVDDAVGLAKGLRHDESIYGMIADFEDAFHTLSVEPNEWKYLIARHPVAGFVGYRTVLCGGAGCPLLWGRAAAFLGRSAQSMFQEHELRTEIFVDDPATLITGDLGTARWRGALLLWWWLALGLKVSWRKGVFGKSFKWIGIDVNLNAATEINLKIPRAFADSISDLAKECLDMKAIPSNILQKLAGKAGWAAGVAPVVWSQVAPLWAAGADAERDMIAKHGKRKGNGKGRTVKVSTARVRSSLVWLVALFGSAGRLLEKTIPYVFPAGMVKNMIFTDASPWGGGGYLAVDGVPVSYWHDAWTDEDLNKFGLERGDCRGQAVWEALALLVSLRIWSGAWRDQVAGLEVRSDSKAALGAFEKERSKSPLINAIAREISLDMALATFAPRLFFGHVAGKENIWADALSRLAEPGADVCLPAALRDVPCALVPVRDQGWWRCDLPRRDAKTSDCDGVV